MIFLNFYDLKKIKGVTALRAHGVNKCFIMTGEQDLEHVSIFIYF